ncbi:MAG: tyrosine-type recombinase/integrase [Candidatus Babeliaceae bacterium]|jgi:site-specific recombinase XerD
MNISEHVHNYAQEMKRRKYSERTVENYVSNLKSFFSWSTKDHPKNINEQDIKAYLSLFDEPNTQRSHHGAIKLFYEICLNQSEKFKYIPYCKKSKKLPIVLSQQEIQRMFNVCENLKHKIILALLYSCGLRVSELINLKWEHLDRSRMIINIIQAKGNKDRQVMLTPELIPLLEKYYKQYHPKEYVLNGQFSLQYSDRSVNEVMKQLADKAKINKRVYTHLIRHCSFTHMVEQGIDINLIQRLAGHSSVKTTSIYCHTSHNLISKIPSPLNSITL